MRLRWWRKPRERSCESKVQLARLMDRDPEVKNLGQELREAEKRNHFSDMVNTAMRRMAREGHP